MSELSKISSALKPQLDRLNERIMLALSCGNDMMNTIVKEYLRRRGKQVRPIMVILCARLFNAETTNKVIATAASVEMLHNASLIHDDVVDDTETRRNEPTINGIWDNHIAVLVGDFFTSTSLQMANEAADLRIINSLSELGRQLAMGELDQISNARYHRLSRHGYLQTIERKTASLFMHCAEMGAYAAGAESTDRRVETLMEFARLLGLCFQITDDIFDYFPNEKEIGKPTGNDLREGKVTLPLLEVLLRPEAPDHQQMLALVSKEQLSADEIQTLLDYAVTNGGIEAARAECADMAARAEQILCSAFPESEARTLLLGLLKHIISRTC